MVGRETGHAGSVPQSTQARFFRPLPRPRAGDGHGPRASARGPAPRRQDGADAPAGRAPDRDGNRAQPHPLRLVRHAELRRRGLSRARRIFRPPPPARPGGGIVSPPRRSAVRPRFRENDARARARLSPRPGDRRGERAGAGALYRRDRARRQARGVRPAAADVRRIPVPARPRPGFVRRHRRP